MMNENATIFEGGEQRIKAFAACLKAWDIQFEYLDDTKETLIIKDQLTARRFAKQLWKEMFKTDTQEVEIV